MPSRPSSDFSDSSRSRRRFVDRPFVVVLAVVALVAGLGAAGFLTFQAAGDQSAAARWKPAPAAREVPTTTPSPAPSAAGDGAISMSATGDIVMANAPGRMPPRDGEGYFNAVKELLAADLVMGNLEEPLTDDTGTGKCGKTAKNCHQFRAPPSYARHLRDAGFELLNQANNHGNDYGPTGYRNTQRALEAQGLLHTGAPDEITVVDVEGVKVAVAGFSSYSWSNSLINIASAQRVVEKAATLADIVVVQVHMGAEGTGATHVKPGTEIAFGENRGDPMKFSHAMIDSGADLIVGHGPHVLRGMEFYKGRLIAYSLGNFAGSVLNSSGRLGWGGVLKVTLNPDGSWVSGAFSATTHATTGGLPKPDPNRRGLGAVRDLSRQDFPSTGARFGDDGAISPPSA